MIEIGPNLMNLLLEILKWVVGAIIIIAIISGVVSVIVMRD